MTVDVALFLPFRIFLHLEQSSASMKINVPLFYIPVVQCGILLNLIVGYLKDKQLLTLFLSSVCYHQNIAIMRNLQKKVWTFKWTFRTTAWAEHDYESSIWWPRRGATVFLEHLKCTDAIQKIYQKYITFCYQRRTCISNSWGYHKIKKRKHQSNIKKIKNIWNINIIYIIIYNIGGKG